MRGESYSLAWEANLLNQSVRKTHFCANIITLLVRLYVTSSPWNMLESLLLSIYTLHFLLASQIVQVAQPI